MKLVIIESPNKIKKLQSILSSDYKIIASIGHLFDLPKKELGVDLITFEPEIILDPMKKDILANIKKSADEAEIIYLAADMDREGSGICKNIFDSLSKKNQKKCKRLLINAITKDAVELALKNPSKLDDNMSDAQKGRRVTDRLVGYQISPVMWSKGLKGTSAGRVQSVALKYVADLEKEVLAFKSDEFWRTHIKCDGFSCELYTIDGTVYSPKTKAGAENMKKDILSGKSTAKVTEYLKKTRTRSPEPPFITSTLQQVASGMFGWNAQKTMQVAQTLFSSGLITYLRTDSVRSEPDKIVSIRNKVELKLGKNYVAPSIRNYANKDSAQDAHEAIRPTYDSPLNPLTPDEEKLLRLIDSRFRASQMADAVFDQASLKIEVTSAKHTYIFKINGSIMTFDGFLKVYGENKDDVSLPLMSVGSAVPISDVSISQHFTQPPGRYSDASLIKKLEKEGVGRPSTYASIVETLINRGYATRDKKSLRASELGLMVSDYLSNAFPKLVDSEMTAKMELSLDKIAEGKETYMGVISSFYNDLSASIAAAKKLSSADIFKVDRKCPECSSHMLKKKSEHHIFLGCASYPKCGYTINIDANGNESIGAQETGEPCPECGNVLKEREGKWGGKWISCAGYPACKYVKKDTGSAKPKKPTTPSKFDCPKCNIKMVIRTSAFGEFNACINWPKCKYTYNERVATANKTS